MAHRDTEDSGPVAFDYTEHNTYAPEDTYEGSLEGRHSAAYILI